MNNDAIFHGPSPILGPDGQPMPRKADLLREVAAPELMGVRAFWDQAVASGLTPEKLAAILRESVRGDIRPYVQLAEDMEERDLHYGAVLGVRKRALSGITAVVNDPPGKKADPKVKAAVEALVRAPQFRDLVDDLMDAIGKGFAVCEIIWGEEGGFWMPRAYRYRDPKFFTFDYISRSEVRLAVDGTIDGEALPPSKFIVHRPRLKSGIPIRGGLARFAAWGFCFKQFTLKDWAAFLDVYGMPLRVGKYNNGASADERRALLRAVTNIASDAAAIIPASMAIDFIETKPGAGKPFEDKARYIDEQVSKAVLGQTMATDNGSSLGQAKVHNDVRIDICESDGRQMANTLNTDLIASFVALNFGAHEPCPRAEFPLAKPEDIDSISQALERLVPLGLRVAQREVREKIGFGMPDDKEEVLGPAAPPEASERLATSRQTLQRAMNRALADARGDRTADLDELADAGAEDWEEQVDPIVSAIRAAAASASSFEEFEQRLNELAGELDTDAMARRLAVASIVSRGIGRSE